MKMETEIDFNDCTIVATHDSGCVKAIRVYTCVLDNVLDVTEHLEPKVHSECFDEAQEYVSENLHNILEVDGMLLAKEVS
jgi:hypothetical protein